MTVNKLIKHVNLGNSGLRVSNVILGCMSYGTSDWAKWVINEAESLPIIKAAYDAGIRTWDTADLYSGGESERVLGKALKKYNIPRKKVVIMTKCYMTLSDKGPSDRLGIFSHVEDPEYANQGGLSRKHIFDAVDDSLERLQTSYIDVLQIHRLDLSTPKEEIMRALHDVVQSGKVRYIGASSMFAWEFAQLQFIAEKNGWTKFISMQNYHNLLYREEEREMNPFCKDTGVALIPWSPIARGALARPLEKQMESVRASSDHLLKALIHDPGFEADREIISRTEEIAKKLGVSMAVVAQAWAISKGDIPIVGISKKERIDDAIKATELKLTDEDVKYLEEKYQPKPVQGLVR